MKTACKLAVVSTCAGAAWVAVAGQHGSALAAEAEAKIPAGVESLWAGEMPIFEMLDNKVRLHDKGGNVRAIAVAMDGSVLMFRGMRKEGIIEVDRSEDGGKTWQDPIAIGNLVVIEGEHFDGGRYKDLWHGRSLLGNVIVDETTGDVMVFCSGLKPAPVLYRSQDHGKTWKPEDIVINPDVNGWLSCTMASSEAGITLRYGKRKGRLLMPTRVFWGYFNKRGGNDVYAKHYSNALYSDDHGRTWIPSAPFPLNGTGEAALAELRDGRIYYNSRTHLRAGNRRIAWSDDCGETWKDEREDDELFDGPPDVYGCKAGMVRLPYDDRDILIFSRPDRKETPRDDATVWVSFDGGETWPVKRLVREGPGSYTWLAAGRKGTPSEGMIYLISLMDWGARFNLAWIMEGGPK